MSCNKFIKLIKLIKMVLLSVSLFMTQAHAEMILRRGNCAEPQSLDPQLSGDVQGGHILRDLFEGLVAEDMNGNLIPGMAKNWTISEDGLTYTFHLREAKWSNGQPLTAEDFVYAWRRAVNPKTGNHYAFLLYPVSHAEAIATGKESYLNKLGITANDKYTLTVTLQQPTPYFLSLLTHSITYPVPKHSIEKYGKLWTKPQNMVSNGAFTLTQWIPHAHMTLTQSKHYWNKDSVQLDKVIYYPTEDRNAEFKRFRTGEIDWTCDIPNEQLPFIKKQLTDSFKSAPYLGVYYYGFNTTKAPFKDNLPLRKALTLAIDRDTLVNKVIGAGEIPAYSLVMPGVLQAKTYQPAYANLSPSQREKLAKSLYQTAGYSKDKPLEIELRYNTSSNHKNIAVAIAAMWKEVLGVKTHLVNEEWKVFLQSRQQKNTQVFRAGWIGDYNDANTFLALFHSNSGKNDVGFHSSTFDTLLNQAGEETNPNQRANILRAAEKELIDSYAVIPIYYYVIKHLIHPKVHGYSLNVMNHSRSQYIWLEQ